MLWQRWWLKTEEHKTQFPCVSCYQFLKQVLWILLKTSSNCALMTSFKAAIPNWVYHWILQSTLTIHEYPTACLCISQFFINLGVPTHFSISIFFKYIKKNSATLKQTKKHTQKNMLYKQYDQLDLCIIVGPGEAHCSQRIDTGTGH